MHLGYTHCRQHLHRGYVQGRYTHAIDMCQDHLRLYHSCSERCKRRLYSNPGTRQLMPKGVQLWLRAYCSQCQVHMQQCRSQDRHVLMQGEDTGHMHSYSDQRCKRNVQFRRWNYHSFWINLHNCLQCRLHDTELEDHLQQWCCHL
jgi:hypothetical protein